MLFVIVILICLKNLRQKSGVSIFADHAEKVLHFFWKDPANDLLFFFKRHYRTLQDFGQFLYFFQDPAGNLHSLPRNGKLIENDPVINGCLCHFHHLL